MASDNDISTQIENVLLDECDANVSVVCIEDQLFYIKNNINNLTIDQKIGISRFIYDCNHNVIRQSQDGLLVDLDKLQNNIITNIYNTIQFYHNDKYK